MQQVAITITNQFVVKTQKIALNLQIEGVKNKDHWFTGTDRMSWLADEDSVKSIKDCWLSCVNIDAIIHPFLDGYTQRLSEFNTVLKELLIELYEKAVFHGSSKMSYKIEFNDTEITLTINTTLTK